MQLHVSPAALVHEVCSRGSTVPPLQRLAPRIPCRGHRVCERWTFDCGARPVSERPPGVDWTISLWAEERGEYCPTDRGYEGRRSRQV